MPRRMFSCIGLLHADVLMVEQEIVGDDRTALAAVMEADATLMKLKAEEVEIEK